MIIRFGLFGMDEIRRWDWRRVCSWCWRFRARDGSEYIAPAPYVEGLLAEPIVLSEEGLVQILERTGAWFRLESGRR
ncbi:MAG: hypothetical protein M2R45_03359 [Verrucomicrobia subdivision 3 bacterium]|nr:hypothetical protein [Limisphaerales bacterium]MCS1416728.1 hypothetical protein [Limisphaerales bacterium]